MQGTNQMERGLNNLKQKNFYAVLTIDLYLV